MKGKSRMIDRSLVPRKPSCVRNLTIASCVVYSAICISAQAGAPIRGADVKLGSNPGGNAAARTTTDNKGAFAIHGLAPGSYTVVFNPCSDASEKPAGGPKSN